MNETKGLNWATIAFVYVWWKHKAISHYTYLDFYTISCYMIPKISGLHVSTLHDQLGMLLVFNFIGWTLNLVVASNFMIHIILKSTASVSYLPFMIFEILALMWLFLFTTTGALKAVYFSSQPMLYCSYIILWTKMKTICTKQIPHNKKVCKFKWHILPIATLLEHY